MNIHAEKASQDFKGDELDASGRSRCRCLVVEV